MGRSGTHGFGKSFHYFYLFACLYICPQSDYNRVGVRKPRYKTNQYSSCQWFLTDWDDKPGLCQTSRIFLGRSRGRGQGEAESKSEGICMDFFYSQLKGPSSVSELGAAFPLCRVWKITSCVPKAPEESLVCLRGPCSRPFVNSSVTAADSETTLQLRTQQVRGAWSGAITLRSRR